MNTRTIAKALSFLALILGIPFFYLAISNLFLHAMGLLANCSFSVARLSSSCVEMPLISELHSFLSKANFLITMFLSFSRYGFQPVIPYYLAMIMILSLIIMQKFKPQKATLIVGLFLLLPAIAYGVDQMVFMPRLSSRPKIEAPVINEEIETFDCTGGYQITLTRQDVGRQVVRYTKADKGFSLGVLIQSELKLNPYNWSSEHKAMLENIVRTDFCKNKQGDSLSIRINPVTVPEFNMDNPPAPGL